MGNIKLPTVNDYRRMILAVNNGRQTEIEKLAREFRTQEITIRFIVTNRIYDWILPLNERVRKSHDSGYLTGRDKYR